MSALSNQKVLEGSPSDCLQSAITSAYIPFFLNGESNFFDLKVLRFLIYKTFLPHPIIIVNL